MVPFAAKVLESTKDSPVFAPPNPWVVGLLRTLCELYRLFRVGLAHRHGLAGRDWD